MATAYPGGVDNFTNPTASDTLNSATVPHAEQHANANDAIEAIETELGTNPSGAYSTVKDRLDAIGTTVTAPITNAGSTVAPVIGINASSSDTANYVVQRDANQSFSIGAINFDTLSSQVSAAAKLYWDGQQTLNLGLGGGNVSIALGQEVISYVTNAEATTLAVGEVVYLYGAQGDRPTVKRASNASDTTSSKTFGIVAESIAAGGSGFVMNRGVAQKVNTAAFNPGDILWLGSTPGTFTTTKPVAPEHLVFVGVVLRSNSGNGLVFVSPQNGYELGEIHDVLLTSETDGDLLKYDGASGLWKNAAQSTLGVSYTQVSGLGTAATKDTGVAGGVATLDGAGLVPTNQLPALAITNTYVVASEAAMLALTAQPGDVAVRTDLSKSYILTAEPASTLGNWQELLTPPDAVTSVDGRAGAVTLTDKYASLAAANAFTVGGHTITNAAAAAIPLSITGAAGQSSDLFRILDSGLTARFRVLSGGRTFINPSSTGDVPLTLRLAASATADGLQVQDSSSNVLTKVEANGRIAVTPTAVVANALVEAAAVAGQAYPLVMGRVGASWVAAINPTGFDSYFQGRFAPTNASTVPLVVTAAASQTANLFEVRDSANAIKLRIGANNGLYAVGLFTDRYIQDSGAALPYLDFNGSTIAATARSSAQVSLTVKGAASQSVDIQQWQDSAGTLLGRFTNNGTLFANNLGVFGNTTGALGRITAYAGSAGTIGAVIRGAASQTANLTEWQNSSGTVLTAVRNDGLLLLGSNLTYLNGTVAAPVLNAVSNSATQSVISVTGATSQSGNYITIVDSLAVAQFNVRPSGIVGLNQIVSAGGSALRADFQSATNNMLVPAVSATAVPIIAKGFASQTANLQEWQNSGGTAQLYVTSSGTIKGNGTFNSGATATQFDANGNFTVSYLATLGTLTARTLTATLSPLVVQGAASQTAQLTQWQNSSGTTMAYVDQFGGSKFTYGQFISDGATTRPLLVRVVSTQTANAVDIHDSASTIIGGRNSNAQIFSGSTAPLYVATGGATTAATGDGTTATITTTSAHGLAVGDMVTVAGVTPTGYNGTFRVTAVPTTTSLSYANATTGAQTVAGTVSAAAQASIVARSAGTAGLVVRGAASQSANLFEVQGSSANTLVAIYGSGTAVFNNRMVIGGDASARLNVVSSSATQVQTVIRGFVSQSANLTEWQNSSGTLLTAVNAYGAVGIIGTPFTSSAQLFIRTGAASYVGAAIRGEASQTGDLLQLQNSSGTVLSKVDSAGFIYTPRVRTTNDYGIFGEVNSGGFVTLTKMPSAPLNTGPGTARLYFRDGTTAGTLKLVVMAGAAGAETTILDNIPQ